jgi:hypothetical protein
VLNSPGNDDELPRPEIPVAVAELHAQPALDDEEQLVTARLNLSCRVTTATVMGGPPAAYNERVTLRNPRGRSGSNPRASAI